MEILLYYLQLFGYAENASLPDLTDEINKYIREFIANYDKLNDKMQGIGLDIIIQSSEALSKKKSQDIVLIK